MLYILHLEAHFGHQCLQSLVKVPNIFFWQLLNLFVFGTNPTGTMESFIYQSSAQPRKVVIICAFLIFSSWICHTIQTTSQRNQCCYGYSNLFPLNIGSLMSAPAIVFVFGTIKTKFGLVELPCPLFTVLVVLVFTELLGDMSHDLTSGTVGEL